MDPGSAVVALAAIVGGSCIAISFITTAGKALTRGKSTNPHELQVAQERVRQLELQLVESHRQADLLQKQVDWHSKLLETQDRVMRQIGTSGSLPDPTASAPSRNARSAV
jgi:hypothetical protein